MQRLNSILLVSVFIIPISIRGQLLPVLGAQRAGTATAQFLKIGVGARASAMGESFVAVANDASALYWNPAGIAQFDGNQIIVAHTRWLADIQHEFVGAVYRLSTADAVGLSFTSLQTDDMPVTTEFHPTGNGDYFRFGDIAVGVSYARRMTSQFSFGATVRYFNETMDKVHMQGVVVDLGTYYWTELGTSRFSAVVTNFGNQVSPTGEIVLQNGQAVRSFQEFSPPTLFRFGFAFEPINEETNSLTTSIQLNHPNDNSENVSLGAEYRWMHTLFLRAGYKLNVDEQQLSAGIGLLTTVESFGVGVDYGYNAFERLGGVHRISLSLRL